MIRLPELTPQDITALLNAPRKSRRKRKKYALSFDPTNTLVFLPVTPSALGHFDGKVGTMRRSRKGRTYRSPNGQRYYDGLDQVIAYKL